MALRGTSLRIGAAYLDERNGMPNKVFVERKQMVAVNSNFAIGENEPQRLGWYELHHIQARIRKTDSTSGTRTNIQHVNVMA